MFVLRDSVEKFIRQQELIPPGGAVTCLVSGGADSSCLWHVLTALGYRVSALHVNHGLRGADSDEDGRFCAERFGAEVVDAPGGTTEDDWRAAWQSYRAGGAEAAGIVDHISFVVMRRLGITKAFTNDRHFRAAGFEVLF